MLRALSDERTGLSIVRIIVSRSLLQVCVHSLSVVSMYIVLILFVYYMEEYCHFYGV
jgi:hypothetical protein